MCSTDGKPALVSSGQGWLKVSHRAAIMASLIGRLQYGQGLYFADGYEKIGEE